MEYHKQFEELSILKVLGNRLKELRVKKGLTIKKLAKLANIERNGYAMIETGNRKVSIGLLCKIAIALETTPASFFDNEFYEKYTKYLYENDPENILDKFDYTKLDVIKISSILKNYRKDHKLSQEELANIIGEKRGIINNLENGRGKLNNEIILACSKLLNLTPEKLIEILK